MDSFRGSGPRSTGADACLPPSIVFVHACPAPVEPLRRPQRAGRDELLEPKAVATGRRGGGGPGKGPLRLGLSYPRCARLVNRKVLPCRPWSRGESGAAAGRVLCVGDSLRTDVAGGRGIGAGTLFTVGGIHHAEILVEDKIELGRLAALCRKLGQNPDYAIAHLAW